MMFDTAAYFGQPTFNPSPFMPQGALGAYPGQYGQLPGQAIAGCLAPQQLAAQQQQLQLAAQLGLLGPTPFGAPVFGNSLAAHGQPMGGWPVHQQAIPGPQALFGALAGQLGQQPFGQQPLGQAFGAPGLSGIFPASYWQQPLIPVGAWPYPVQIPSQFAGASRSFQPLQAVPHMAYAG